MLNQLDRIKDNVFQVNKECFRKTFEALRKRTVKRLGKPRLNGIHLHTFRHWKGTTEYHKTNACMHSPKI